MNILNFFEILFIINSCLFWLTDEECIMSISGWMSLWLEKSVKVPKRRFHITISFHFLESHFCKNLDKLLFSFHKDVKISVLDFSTFWVRIKFFEMGLFPWTIRNHSTCEISDELNSWFSVFRTFRNYEVSFSFLFNQLSLLECFKIIFINFLYFSSFDDLK